MLLPPLHPEIFQSLLNTRELGRSFYYFESLPSTNDHARALMEEDDRDHVLVIAESQSAGRGRQGRSWDSPKGTGLYFSLGIRSIKEGPPELLTLRVGLILAQVAERYIKERVWVKWPNDLWIENKKTAGILVESKISGNRASYFVLGIGINVISPHGAPPADRHYLLTETKPYVREAILASLINDLEMELYQQPFSRENFHRNWDKYDLLKGRQVRVLTGTGEWEGIAMGIDEQGSLMVEDEDGKLQKVSAADVSIRPKKES